MKIRKLTVNNFYTGIIIKIKN